VPKLHQGGWSTAYHVPALCRWHAMASRLSYAGMDRMRCEPWSESQLQDEMWTTVRVHRDGSFLLTEAVIATSANNVLRCPAPPVSCNQVDTCYIVITYNADFLNVVRSFPKSTWSRTGTCFTWFGHEVHTSFAPPYLKVITVPRALIYMV